MNATRSHSLSLDIAAVNKEELYAESVRTRGFTLIELFVVVAIIVILAATLLPALASSKASTKADQCMANTRQLTLAWAMYASDNRQTFVSSGPGLNGWVQGTISWENLLGQNQDNTLLVGPRSGSSPQPALGTYLKDPRVFKDPADYYQTATSGYRNRSYSMNGALGPGAGPTVLGTAPGNRKYYGSDPNSIGVGRNAVDMSDLIHPSMVYVILDEHADSINDGKFMFNPGGGPFSAGAEQWRDLPASYHNGGGCFSFADGHSVIHHWQDRRTVWPVACLNYASASQSPWGHLNLNISPDYEWMDDHMPYR